MVSVLTQSISSLSAASMISAIAIVAACPATSNAAANPLLFSALILSLSSLQHHHHENSPNAAQAPQTRPETRSHRYPTATAYFPWFASGLSQWIRADLFESLTSDYSSSECGCVFGDRRLPR
ncbi:hypothetical protein F4860DRAFT_457189 [Xylaria cubensis]|nr:hypothetical protein F4860DRAFT_457189 [Xylaria cubensis]